MYISVGKGCTREGVGDDEKKEVKKKRSNVLGNGEVSGEPHCRRQNVRQIRPGPGRPRGRPRRAPPSRLPSRRPGVDETLKSAAAAAAGAAGGRQTAGEGGGGGEAVISEPRGFPGLLGVARLLIHGLDGGEGADEGGAGGDPGRREGWEGKEWLGGNWFEGGGISEGSGRKRAFYAWMLIEMGME